MIAVAEQHVSPGFPYISDTGGKPPESCVFTFICCVSGMISKRNNTIALTAECLCNTNLPTDSKFVVVIVLNSLLK